MATDPYGTICVACEIKQEQAVNKLYRRLVLARAEYERNRTNLKILGESHSDGAHGLQRASSELEAATQLYSKALIERTHRIIGDKPKPVIKPE